MVLFPVDSDLWCRRFHPSPDAVERLVCFPHAGGSASFYFPVSAALAGRVDVVALQYPGRQDRRAEPCVEDLGVLADAVLDALRGQDDLPLTFFGHSMGALLAFEVARRLEREGRTIERLFASGRVAPSVPRRESLHLLPDDDLVAAVTEMSGTDALVLADEEIRRMALPALRADLHAVETYHCAPGAPLECPVTVLIGDTDPRTPPDDARAWQSHTTASCDLETFPGGHFFLSDHPKPVLTLLHTHHTPTRRPA
ncbi:thioesterase II family protein [Streptomyces sp. NPDC086091]|uniref:thioesterase II family protein n=1 Tax=Streptomyces sp. NPDC086091 TaxID=3365751 RepID=UPI0037F1B0E9